MYKLANQCSVAVSVMFQWSIQCSQQSNANVGRPGPA